MSMLFLLLVAVGIQSSIAWPYSEGDSDLTGSKVTEKNIEDELVQEQTDDVSAQDPEQLQSAKDFKDANAEADYAGLSQTAEIIMIQDLQISHQRPYPYFDTCTCRLLYRGLYTLQILHRASLVGQD